MKKFLITTVVTAVVALSLIGCGGASKSISPKSLPASGATTFFSSQEDLVSFMTEIAGEDLANDPGIMLIGAALADVDPDDIKPNLEDIFTKEEERAEEYAEKLMSDGKDGFLQSGKASYAINRKIGKLKGLPEGISMAVPSSSAKVDVALNRNGKGTANANYDVSASMGFDAVKLLGKEDAESCIVKGLIVNVATNADVKANLLSQEMSNDDTFMSFLYGLNDVNAKVNALVEMNVGWSMCAPSGLGGIAIASIKISLDDTFTQDSITDLTDTFYRVMNTYEPTKEDLEKLPIKFEVSAKLYDDSGKETYSETETLSSYELYQELLPALEMLEDLL